MALRGKINPEMSKMQERRGNQDGKNGPSRTKTAYLLSLVSTILILGLIVLPSQAQALKVIVYFGYDQWHKQNPKQIGKIDLYVTSDTDSYRKNLKASFMAKLPKTKTINLDVPVNGEFIVHLNSGKRDEGFQESGTNRPVKAPEKLEVRVP